MSDLTGLEELSYLSRIVSTYLEGKLEERKEIAQLPQKVNYTERAIKIADRFESQFDPADFLMIKGLASEEGMTEEGFEIFTDIVDEKISAKTGKREIREDVAGFLRYTTGRKERVFPEAIPKPSSSDLFLNKIWSDHQRLLSRKQNLSIKEDPFTGTRIWVDPFLSGWTDANEKELQLRDRQLRKSAPELFEGEAEAIEIDSSDPAGLSEFLP